MFAFFKAIFKFCTAKKLIYKYIPKLLSKKIDSFLASTNTFDVLSIDNLKNQINKLSILEYKRYSQKDRKNKEIHCEEINLKRLNFSIISVPWKYW